jgi:GTP cyclohydrolase I
MFSKIKSAVNMIDKEKTNNELGRNVHEYLVSKGVETPLVQHVFEENEAGIKKKKQKIEKHFNSIMEELGMDMTNDSLSDTPRRVAKMYVDELFWGLDYSNFPKCTSIRNEMEYDEMVLEKGITVMSACEHHFVTIDGKAKIAYIPDKTVLGLSKLNRIVEFFSRRPQVQERLTEQIFYALNYILGTDDIAVVIDAVHYCVKSRGVRDYNSSTITSKLGGRFRTEPELRMEFLSIH